MIVESLLQTCSNAWFALSWRMTAVLLGHRLPALSFIAVRSEITSQQPMSSLPGLNNQIDDFLPLPFVNRYLERLLARGRPEKCDCQVAFYIRLRLWLLRCFQYLEKLSGLGGRLET